jgi:hypothetical protein
VNNLHVAQTVERRPGYGNHVNANIHYGSRVVGAIPSVQSSYLTVTTREADLMRLADLPEPEPIPPAGCKGSESPATPPVELE